MDVELLFSKRPQGIEIEKLIIHKSRRRHMACFKGSSREVKAGCR